MYRATNASRSPALSAANSSAGVCRPNSVRVCSPSSTMDPSVSVWQYISPGSGSGTAPAADAAYADSSST